MIKAGIIGGAGYTGGELIRLLLRHPHCEISCIYSRSQAGRPVNAVHTDLIGETELKFTGTFSLDVDVLFLCMGHGESSRFFEGQTIPDGIKIIDLSQDFRISNPEKRTFCYGLPELYRDRIKSADNIANPGCFATAIQLALIPLAKNQILPEDVHISGITGSTGAGQKPSQTAHFSWRSSNISLYKAFEHQHLSEINKTIKTIQENWTGYLNFLPFRGNFTRGILASSYMKIDAQLQDIKTLFSEYYSPHPFVFISDRNPDLKQAVNTNKCIIYVEKHDDKLLIVSIIDNLLKGASGQAVQNMNLMFSLNETEGLGLKAAAF